MITALGLAAGNFLYQAVFKETPDWRHAFMISFFQSLAIFAYWLGNNVKVH